MQSLSFKMLLVAVVFLAAIVAGFLGGIVSRLNGCSIPDCILRGSAAWAASATLFILALSSVGLLN